MDEAELRDLIPPKQQNPLLKRKPLNLGNRFIPLDSPQQIIELENNLFIKPILTLLLLQDNGAIFVNLLYHLLKLSMKRSIWKIKKFNSSMQVLIKSKKIMKILLDLCHGQVYLCLIKKSRALKNSTMYAPPLV